MEGEQWKCRPKVDVWLLDAWARWPIRNLNGDSLDNWLSLEFLSQFSSLDWLMDSLVDS